jgi:trimeric autotransporter adhesin
MANGRTGGTGWRATVRALSKAGALALAFALLHGPAAGAATITVDTVDDDGSVTGDCELREAIAAADSNAGVDGCTAGAPAPTVDEIGFQIGGAGPHLISPASSFAAIVEPLRIDGSTDGGDEIRLDGGATTGHGLQFAATADGSAVVALTVTAFAGSNSAQGISSSADGFEVEDSFIGTDRAGTAGLGNRTGIALLGVDGVVRDTWVSGNELTGITLNGSGHLVAGSRVGIDPGAPATALPNGGTGISVEARADGMRIGGPDVADRNVISGNTGSGVAISGFSAADPADGAFDNIVENNRIGTSLNGEVAIGNGNHGIALLSHTARTDVLDNVISANDVNGIQLNPLVNAADGSPGPSDNLFAGNRIGTDDDGETALGNGGDGVALSSGIAEHALEGNVIGGEDEGSCDGDCNLISGNDSLAIGLFGNVVGTEVLGNVIGLDDDGLQALGNGLGLHLDEQGGLIPSGNRIGAPGAGNAVGANGGLAGIEIRADDGVVQSNLIGVTVDALTPMPNGTHAISLSSGADRNLIGGTGAGERNLILFSDAHGIEVLDGVDNPILGNTINANDALGVDLDGGTETGPGVTVNDPLDADTGANDLQNFPVIEEAVAGESTTVTGALESEPEADYRIEVFSSNVPDASGFGEGRTLLGALEVATDGSGNVEFTATLNGATAPGEVVTATATALGASGEPLSTSEFSAAVVADECDVTGTDGDDVLIAAPGEVVCGLGGDDVLSADGGDPLLLGGEGNDTIDLSGAAAAADLSLPGGVAQIGGDAVRFEEFEHAIGTSFADVISGDGAANDLEGGAGADTLTGAAGADSLVGGTGADELDGDEGADTLVGDEGADELEGGLQADTLDGEAGADTLKGNEAADTLRGDGGADDINGNDGADTVRGGDGGDELKGNDGRDDLKGQDGNDDLKGQAANDELAGNAGGSDVCNGGDGGGDKNRGGCETRRKIP